MTVFVVSNDSERSVLPEAGAIAKFTAYYLNGSEK
jgi:hypothetical protein